METVSICFSDQIIAWLSSSGAMALHLFGLSTSAAACYSLMKICEVSEICSVLSGSDLTLVVFGRGNRYSGSGLWHWVSMTWSAPSTLSSVSAQWKSLAIFDSLDAVRSGLPSHLPRQPAFRHALLFSLEHQPFLMCHSGASSCLKGSICLFYELKLYAYVVILTKANLCFGWL